MPNCSGPAAPAGFAPDVPVPPQDGAGGDDQPHRGETVDRQRPGQQGKQRPVRPRQTRMSARPLAFSHSELMAQHKDLGVLPPALPPRQAQQRHRTGDNQEDQLQARKPKIISRPGRPRPDSHVPDAGPSDQRPAEHPARWHGFSAPTGSYRTRPACRRSTAFSCGSTSNSASLSLSPRTIRTARLNSQRISRQTILSSTGSANHRRASHVGEQAAHRHDRVFGRHSMQGGPHRSA